MIDWFIQCIGPDKCESSKDEYETIVLRKGSDSFDADHFEYIPQSEVVADPNENPCHIRYMNGRIFYGNRFPLPTKLSFSAIPSSSSDLFVLEQFGLRSGDKCGQYHCVHNIKDFADNKMRDRHPVGNSSSTDDIDNSDDEQHFSIPVEKVDEKITVEEDGELALTINNHVLLCDDASLRTHSNRLNAQPKATQVRKINSPNAKKIAFDGSKSPSNKKSVSPLSINPLNIEGGFISQTVQQESSAIQTAKKLKRILETNSTDDKTKSQKSHMLSKPIKKQKRAHEYCSNSVDDETETVEINNINGQTTTTMPEIQWTREEDRQLLEQIKDGLDSNAVDMNRFPNKTLDQIRDRYIFLIDFLTKLRNKQN